MKLLNKGIIYLSLGTAFIAVSCADESPWGSSDKADGKIHLYVKADGQVNKGTRADDMSPLVPNEAEFSISLKSTDGSYNNTWKNLNAFNGEDGFPMGSYIISASFGDMDTEGFNNPYFYGEAPVSVTKGSESSANITATLANAMLSIRYSEDLKKIYPGYSAAVITEGHDPVVFVQGENRPAYISAGLKADVKLTLTNSGNNTVTISPTNFKADPQKHYILTFGLEGDVNIGDAFLSIEWSEEVVTEDKEIPLSDELFTTPGPSVTLEGYSNNESLFEGLEYENVNPEFHIVALGGLTHATLTLTAEENNGVVPTGFSSIDLVTADANSQSILKTCGIVCDGLYENPDKFAVVNLKEYIKGLTPGSYTAKIDVEDKLFRSLDTPVEFKVVITGLEYNFLTYENPDFLDEKVIVYIESNSPDLKDQLNFKAGIDNSNYAEVSSLKYLNGNAPANKPAELPYVYAYELTLREPIDNYEWMVQAQVPNKKAHETVIEVNMPVFTVDVDAFAKKVKFRINPEQTSVEKYGKDLFNDFKLYKGSQLISSGYSYDSATGIITLTEGIAPDTNYNDFVISLGRTPSPSDKSKISAFQSEKNTDVPNGDFETEPCPQNMIEKGAIQVGGQWKVGAIDYTIKSSINRNVASGWSNLNAKTCNPNAINKNSWYIVPSTYVENIDGVNTNIIRSVGYHENGSNINKSGQFWTTTYYCTNSPSELKRSIGELFLGSYEYNNNSEQRVNGVLFESRPSKFSFDYSYTSIENEEGEFTIEILDENNQPLFSHTESLSSSISMIPIEIEIKNYQFGIKAKKIFISFKSSKNNTNPSIYIPKDDELYEGKISLPITPYIVYKDANDYKALATGSELRISNVHFEY
ncbi:MAG: DUF4493 domain-containing protein [Muribaculaceae bacterium]|nr:DUF4493 domain-containing protein [Muribaculaceae bacterium]